MSEKQEYTFEEIMDELEQLVYWLSHQNADENTPLMDWEEISGELWLELVKGFQTYGDKPKDECIRIIQTMLGNRCSELIYKYHKTHRKEAKFSIDLDVALGVHLESSPTAISTSRQVVQETRESLSETGQRVFDAVIHGHPILSNMIRLSGLRASEIYKTRGTVRVKKWHVADSLGLTDAEVRAAFKEIRTAYKQANDNHRTPR